MLFSFCVGSGFGRSLRVYMKDWAETFYNSPSWKQTRKAYTKSVGGLCEICQAKGIIKPGVIVHHKVWLTPENINDTDITLDWNNLQLVCREHHAQIHFNREKRWRVDELGRVSAWGD